MEEIWKPVVGFEGNYEVSNLGNVRSLDRVTYNNKRIKGKEMPQFVDHNGYLNVNLTKQGRCHTKKVHRLVAIAFVDNVDSKECIDHINTIKEDNRAANLRWVTQKENVNNPITIKRMREVKRLILTQRVYQYSMSGKFIAVYNSMKEAAMHGNFSVTGIGKACRNIIKSHKNYLWSFEDGKIEYKPCPPKQKGVVQLTKEGLFIKRWESIKDACAGLGLHSGNISRAIAHKQGCQYCGGFAWEYA